MAKIVDPRAPRLDDPARALDALVELSAMPTLVVTGDDPLGPPLAVNRAAADLVGVDRQRLLRTQMAGLLPTDWQPLDTRLLRELVDGRIDRFRRIGHLATPAGSELVLDITVTRVETEGRVQLLLQCLDLSERVAVERHLAEAEQRFRMTFDRAPIGMALFTPAGRVLEANGALSEFLGYDRDELLASTWSELTHPDDVAGDGALLAAVLRGEREGYEVDKRYVRSDGQEVWGRLSVSLARAPGGQPLHFVAQIVDITVQHRVLSRLRAQANRDPLTGLANRRELEERYDLLTEWCDHDRCIALLFCDLDGFKGINDNHGHDVGDRLLQIVGERITRALRPGDLLVRFGGDEFVVACLVARVEDAVHLAERVVETIAHPFNVAGDRLHLGVSVGVSVERPPVAVDHQLSAADAAMYRAKGSRDRVVVAEPVERTSRRGP